MLSHAGFWIQKEDEAYEPSPVQFVYLSQILKSKRAWRKKHAAGDVIFVRYADVFGFENKNVAQRFLQAMREHFAKFGLTLNLDKTRLIEFGRFAAIDRQRRGQGRPETFDFLGFTHCCGTDRRGRFQLVRLTAKKRMRATLAAIREALMRRRHGSPSPLSEPG